MSDSNHDEKSGDAAAERALREGLRAPALSAEALQRIRAAAQQEWRATLDQTKSGRSVAQESGYKNMIARLCAGAAK